MATGQTAGNRGRPLSLPRSSHSSNDAFRMRVCGQVRDARVAWWPAIPGNRACGPHTPPAQAKAAVAPVQRADEPYAGSACVSRTRTGSSRSPNHCVGVAAGTGVTVGVGVGVGSRAAIRSLRICNWSCRPMSVACSAPTTSRRPVVQPFSQTSSSNVWIAISSSVTGPGVGVGSGSPSPNDQSV